MTRYATRDCSCEVPHLYGGQKRPVECPHGNRFQTEAELKPKERQSLRRVSLKRQAEVDTGVRPRTTSTLKPGKGLSASPEQKAKVRDLACIVCGRDRFEITITAMHVYPRRFAACSCADGVVSGCIECHPIYERKGLDLLPLLVAHGFRKELVHAVIEHEAPIFHVLEIVTGVAWSPRQIGLELDHA